MSENQIAVTDDAIKTTLQGWMKADLSFFVGDQGKLKSFMKNAALCIFESKDLRECMTTDVGRVSLLRALQRAVRFGLSLNPQDGESALVAIQGKVNYWPMKNGLIRMAHESGRVEVITAETVYANDQFSLKKTAHGDDYDWTPALKDRGAPVLYFSLLVLKGGRSTVHMMTMEQVQAWKAKYGKGASRQDSAWNTNFDGMAQKTVLKANVKGTYLGKSLEELVELDDETEKTEPEPRNVTPAKGSTSTTVAAELKEKAEKAEDDPVPGQNGQADLSDVF